MSYTIAIFDLDGTLLDTLDDLHAATNAALTHAGYPPRTREEVRAFVGNGVEMLIRRALPAGADESVVPATLADFKAAYAAGCAVKTAPYPGILALLDALRAQNIRIAVVSNKFDAAVKDLCARYFGDRIEVAVGEREADGVRKKPAPDTVFEALRRLGVPPSSAAPLSAVYIGDSEVDIETARAAGLPCLSVTWGFRDEAVLRAAGATAIVRTSAELLSLLAPPTAPSSR